MLRRSFQADRTRATSRERTRSFLSGEDPPSKQAILCAALALFVKNGVEATSIRQIAQQAGYTNPALFKFFESKQALALHLFERCYLHLYSSVAPAAAREPFAAALRAVLDAFIAAMDEDLEAVLFVQDSLRELWPRLPAEARRHSMLAELRKMLQRGAREGAVADYRAADVPIAALLGVLAQLGRMVYFGETRGPLRCWRRDLERALAAIARG